MKLTSRTLAAATFEIARRDGVDAAVTALIGACREAKIEHVLGSVVRRLEALAARDRRETTLALTFAREPIAGTIEKIREYIGARSDALVEVSIDPKIIGGFQARHAGYEYDARISRTIDSLRI